MAIAVGIGQCVGVVGSELGSGGGWWRHRFGGVDPVPGMRVIDRFANGAGWIAHPDERIQRASHLLGDGDEVWVVDPVDAAGVDDLIGEYGDVVGVVVLVDRHTRDAGVIARRHGVPVYLPAWLSGVARRLDVPIERVTTELGETGYVVRRIVDWPYWREAALVGKGTLLVADALGTAEYFRVGYKALGVHPFLRIAPPRRPLRGVTPERVLVGHGAGVFENATSELHIALRDARRTAPKVYVKALRSLLPI